MTMNMLVTDTGNYFAAAFPVAEAYIDSLITPAQLDILKTKSIWFTHANSDTTVRLADQETGDPLTTNATYVKLINAGATSVYYSYFENVTYDEVTYNGHWSWVYTLRDQCVYIQPTAGAEGNLTVAELNFNSTTRNGEYAGLWDWMADQTNN